MQRRPKIVVSTKIEANKDKIYRTNDIHDLAGLVFPNKNAVDLRAAFILIFLAIKYSRKDRISTPVLEDIRKKKAPEIGCKSLWKARATMARLGIIARRDGIYWQFSTKFSKSINNLAAKVAHLMQPNGSRESEEKDWFLLECAKGMKREPLKRQSF